MRFVVGFLALIALFLISVRVQEQFLARERAAREEHSRPSSGDETDVWGRVIVGRPSGADALQPPPPRASAVERAPTSAVPSANGAPQARSAPVARDNAAPAGDAHPGSSSSTRKTWVVQPGETLSEIVRAHYGHAPEAWVQAVARANRLADSSSLRAGAEIVLPPLSDIDGKSH